MPSMNWNIKKLSVEMLSQLSKIVVFCCLFSTSNLFSICLNHLFQNRENTAVPDVQEFNSFFIPFLNFCILFFNTLVKAQLLCKKSEAFSDVEESKTFPGANIHPWQLIAWQKVKKPPMTMNNYTLRSPVSCLSLPSSSNYLPRHWQAPVSCIIDFTRSAPHRIMIPTP